MKIEGVLVDGNYIGAHRYSLLVSNVRSYDFNIPAGAKVTVEWPAGAKVTVGWDECDKIIKAKILNVGTVTTKPDGNVWIEDWEFAGGKGKVTGICYDLDNNETVTVGGWTLDELRQIAGEEAK